MKKLMILVVLSLFLGSIQAQQSMDDRLKAAQERAQAEGKNIFVKFEASWCGWCEIMNEKMHSEASEPLFDKNYVFLVLDVLEPEGKKHLETPGAELLLEKFDGIGKGLPFWVILDANGQMITDSKDPKGNNLGCPSSEEEVAFFTQKLAQSSTLDEEELQIISETFIMK